MLPGELLGEGLDPFENVYLVLGFPFKPFLLPNDLGWLFSFSS